MNTNSPTQTSALRAPISGSLVPISGASFSCEAIREARTMIAVDLSGDELASKELVELAAIYTGGNLSRMARLLLLERLDPRAFHDELDAFKRGRAA